MFSLFDKVSIAVSHNAVAAGTTVQNGTVIDTAGYDGVLFIAKFGALTANQVTSLQAQQDSVAAFTSNNNIAGSKTDAMADNASNKCLVLDVSRPTKRYVRAVINRATANAVIDSCIAICYRAGYKPATNNASVYANKAVDCAAEGTA
jgi:hypothetical protein